MSKAEGQEEVKVINQQKLAIRTAAISSHDLLGRFAFRHFLDHLGLHVSRYRSLVL